MPITIKSAFLSTAVSTTSSTAILFPPTLKVTTSTKVVWLAYDHRLQTCNYELLLEYTVV
jgi:hypothetical protein